jgi:hypothetical protein
MKDTFYVDMAEWQSFEDWFAGLDISMKSDTNRTYLVTVTNSDGTSEYKVNCEFPDELRSLPDNEKLQVFKDALNKYINKCRNERGNI